MNITCLVCLLCPVSAAFAFPSLLLMSPVPARCQNILTFLPEITFFQIEWLRAEQNSGKTKIKTSKEIQLHIECTHNYKKYNSRSTAAEATECPLADQKSHHLLLLLLTTSQYYCTDFFNRTVSYGKEIYWFTQRDTDRKKASNQASQLKLIINY